MVSRWYHMVSLSLVGLRTVYCHLSNIQLTSYLHVFITYGFNLAYLFWIWPNTTYIMSSKTFSPHVQSRFINEHWTVQTWSIRTMDNKHIALPGNMKRVPFQYKDHPGFHTKGRLLVKSNLICPSDKLSWQPGCPILNINIQRNFCISQGNGSSDNLPENLV